MFGPCTRIVRSPSGSRDRGDAVLRPRPARHAQLAALALEHALGGARRGVVAERRDEARLGAERRQRARRDAAAAPGLVERVVELHDRAALERLRERAWSTHSTWPMTAIRVIGYFLDEPSPSSESTARNASWGTSTVPMIFMRFLPFFCFSSSLRLRVTSPP